MFLSHCFSLSLFLSLKSINISLGEDFLKSYYTTKCECKTSKNFKNFLFLNNGTKISSRQQNIQDLAPWCMSSVELKSTHKNSLQVWTFLHQRVLDVVGMIPKNPAHDHPLDPDLEVGTNKEGPIVPHQTPALYWLNLGDFLLEFLASLL